MNRHEHERVAIEERINSAAERARDIKLRLHNGEQGVNQQDLVTAKHRVLEENQRLLRHEGRRLTEEATSRHVIL